MVPCVTNYARHATINKNIEIEQLQGLLMSTTITAGKENHKKENRTTMIQTSPKIPATFCKNMSSKYSHRCLPKCPQKYRAALCDLIEVLRLIL